MPSRRLGSPAARKDGQRGDLIGGDRAGAPASARAGKPRAQRARFAQAPPGRRRARAGRPARRSPSGGGGHGAGRALGQPAPVGQRALSAPAGSARPPGRPYRQPTALSAPDSRRGPRTLQQRTQPRRRRLAAYPPRLSKPSAASLEDLLGGRVLASVAPRFCSASSSCSPSPSRTGGSARAPAPCWPGVSAPACSDWASGCTSASRAWRRRWQPSPPVWPVCS